MKFKNEKRRLKVGLNAMLTLAAIMVLSIASCEKNDVDEDRNATTPNEEVSTTEQDTDFITKYFLGSEVKVRLEEDGTYSLAGSDLRLFEDQLSDSAEAFDENPTPDAGQTSLALGGGVRKWTDGVVYYVINGLSASVRSELQKSFDEWTSKTNVTFKERTNQSNYVTISSSGSNSNSGVATLGMNGSRGFIRLGTRATAVVIIHELGHTLGYIHEQNRSDRDDFVIINFNNIVPDAQDQFFKSNSAIFLTGQFDINSTMMYGSFTFSRNGQPTITDLNGNLLPPRQASISALDIQGTNALYPATDTNPAGPCDGVAEWSPSTQYFVGDRVTYFGSLYERDFTRWNFITRCN
ncbi:M12 family metallopeptidase [Flagellimonas sp. HMM57]|uniref:M12 family metallopeptidase n=1 Tax=unclassified Flagellimonas TaxID=2644544 RepID=UPI0013D6ECDD|nr:MULTISPECIES: M12 family metallopeptidase [unclassified Flagellimonas]UII76702.1 M12 family metallopeptidase [Flagellimonas sp. HMM57]